jgi:predicted PurR-regulated permease PerM
LRAMKDDAGRSELAVFISIRTILLVGAAVAVAWALASIGDVLLLVFLAAFNAAVLAPVVDAMDRRLPWSRAMCSTLLVLGLAALIAGVLALLLAPIVDAVRDLSHNAPRLVDEARQTDLGRSLAGGSDAPDLLSKHAGDIVNDVKGVSGGVVHVGVSALGAITLAVSVVFMTLFLLVDLPGLRSWVGGLLHRDSRVRVEQVTDKIVTTTSRYMLGNLAISLICAVTYGVTAEILGLPYPLALALVAGILDLIPNIGALLAGIIFGVVALTVSVGALIAVVIVIVVYQQIENYVLQPTIIGRAANVSGFTVIVSVLVFGSLFGVIGAVIGVPIAAAIQIVVDELTAARRARIEAEDAAMSGPAIGA